MAKVTVNLEFDRLKASLMQASERGLDKGAGIVQAEAKSILNRPGAFKTRDDKEKNDPLLAFLRRAEGLVDPPGGSPRKRTSRLAGSVMVERTAPNKRKVGPSFTLKYAAIHEYGGTINHPGGTPYIMTKDGPRFISKKARATMEAAGRATSIKFTKPHPIKIPARPYMRPALHRSEAAIASAYAASIKSALAAFRPSKVKP